MDWQELKGAKAMWRVCQYLDYHPREETWEAFRKGTLDMMNEQGFESFDELAAFLRGIQFGMNAEEHGLKK